MNLIELFLIAIGLSMDAFAVSICKGLSTCKVTGRQLLTVGFWFGGFQAFMPALGYFLGSAFEQYITFFDHWAAFILLGLIGTNMIRESLSRTDPEPQNDSFGVKTMFFMAVATSIDALAVGITFALLPDVNILAAVLLIGTVTFIFSGIGLKAGSLFGLKYKAKAEFTGGVILILIGLKILLDHLGILSLPFL